METLLVNPIGWCSWRSLTHRCGKNPVDALDDVVADHLALEHQDYEEVVEGLRQGYQDVKASRSIPAGAIPP
jgi:hypothetical protein